MKKNSNPPTQTSYIEENSKSQFKKGLNSYAKRDYEDAFDKWNPLAQQGLAEAQFNLGRMYALGKGVISSLEKTKYWVQLASDNTDLTISAKAKKYWDEESLSTKTEADISKD